MTDLASIIAVVALVAAYALACPLAWVLPRVFDRSGDAGG